MPALQLEVEPLEPQSTVLECSRARAVPAPGLALMEPEPEPDPWVQLDPRCSPALQRVAGAGLQSHLQPTVVAVVDLKGDLGLTIEPRTNPAPPPAPPCRVKTIRPGSPASKAVPPIKVGDWIVSVQGQHVGSYFAAMNRINTAPVRPALRSTETVHSAANTWRPGHVTAPATAGHNTSNGATAGA